MTASADFQRLRDWFGRLSELPASSREAALTELAASDARLAEELRELLATSPAAESMLDQPAVRPWDELAIWPSIPGYRIESQLGRGGSATVFLARQQKPGFEREVALKVVDQPLDADARRRVRDEQRIQARLEHPGIARLYDAGTTEAGQTYLVMERVEGTSIVRHCAERDLPIRERLSIFLAVLDAVAYAHAAGVVHRDLKPSNILVTPEGVAKLLDFGIAREVAGPGDEEETRTVRRALTPLYASPEQVRGGRVTAVSDVYSLGVVLYELLAEVSPYQLDDEAFELLAEAIRAQDPEAPSSAITRARRDTGLAPAPRDQQEVTRRRRELRGDLDAVVLKALRKAPAERYATVGALASDLRDVLAGRPVGARAAVRGYRTAHWWRRHRLAVLAALLFTALLVIVAVAPWRQLASPRGVNEFPAITALDTGDPAGLLALADGAEAMRRGDAGLARTRFRVAATILDGPGRALALDGLSRAEAGVGEVGSAAQAALGAEQGPSALPLDERERIAARAQAARLDFVHAVPALDRLFARLPDRLDVGLDLVGALLSSGQTEAAASTLGRIEQLPMQARVETRDPRLDLAEAEVAYRLGEHQRSAAASARAAEKGRRDGNEGLRIRAERRHAEAVARLDLRDEARQGLLNAAEGASERGFRREQAAARLGLGKILARSADTGVARGLLEAAGRELEAAGDRAGVADATTALSFLAAKEGAFDDARRLARRAVETARATGDRWVESEALVGELAILNWAGDAAGVLEIRDLTLAALRDAANRQQLLSTLDNLALDAIERLDLERAEEYLDEAAGLADDVGGRLANAGIDRARGFLEETRGAFDRARDHYESALDKARRAETPLSAAVYLEDLAWLELAADQPDTAEQRAREAIAANREIGRATDAAELGGVLAWVAARRGDRLGSERQLVELRTAVPETAGPSLRRLTTEARVAEALGDWMRAVHLRREAVRVVGDIAADANRIDQLHWLARDLAAAGEHAEAVRIARPLREQAVGHGLRGIARALEVLLDGN